MSIPCVSPTPSHSPHADWLAELKDALGQCDHLLDELHREHVFGMDTAILTARVATLRSEIMRLEEGGAMIDPIWTNFLAAPGQTPCGNSPPPPNSTI